MANTKLDARQSVLRSALGMVGSAANDSLDTIFPKIDAELAKLFEDRNVMLTDGGLITFTGTVLQFTENLNIVLNQKISGAAPQVISLGSSNVTFSATGRMWYAVIDRTAGTATQTTDATTLPAATSANQEVFLIAKRVDAGDGTQRVYWRSGMGQNAGQTLRLGASGSGSGGSGTGDDLDALLFRASFSETFDDGPTSSTSSIDTSAAHTDPTTYNAAKAMYTLNYDASKTIAAGTTTSNINISATPAFTVKTGDMVITGGVARRITAVATQTSYTVTTFPTAPTLAAQVTISQAVHTVNLYGLSVDGNSLDTAFQSATFSEILVDYEDTTTAGDNIFDINTAPVVAWDAVGGSGVFTSPQVRATLAETDTTNSVFLPVASNNLIMRWYANKSSGSGSVNLLRFKVFLQKSVSTSTGGTQNSAYAFTNGVGTPVNVSLGVVGGKTTATLTFSYAAGLNSGSPYGSLDVYLNGQLIPRFISSTLTPDASYLETSSTIITLDRDYSSQNISLEVLQRVSVVDSSTTNTTQLSAFKDFSAAGFQGFVSQSALMTATTSAGTPVAGSFFSSISNRASMVDLSQDMRARHGVDTFYVQGGYVLQNEFGPNGEVIWGINDDTFGQCRLAGTWNFVQGSVDGNNPRSTTLNDFMEITFYGTGLNFLTYQDASPRPFSAAVDGGSATSFTNTGNAALTSRQYAVYTRFNVASNLTLGVHTVKILKTDTSNTVISGFEILNESANVVVNPGVSYLGGNKLVLAAQSSFATTAPVTGTRGGRVVAYQKSDGTIGQSFQAAGSQLNIASADHSLEEVVRTFNVNEFSAGRADDFTVFAAGASLSRAFTLDDNTTSLMLSGVNSSFNLNGVGIDGAGGTGVLAITFVGTGLDVVLSTAGNVGTNTVTVDGGASIGTLGTTSLPKVQKIVSGLPFGTHCVKFNSTGAGSQFLYFRSFIVYQPKKPAIPAGAIELADYNSLATYDGTVVTTDAYSRPTGTIFKSPLREAQLIGANWSVDSFSNNVPGGFPTTHGANASNSQTYTFTGTGFMWDTFSSGGGTQIYTVTIDGSLNASGVSRNGWTNGGGGTYTLATSVGCGRLEFTGLAMKAHTVVINRTGGAGSSDVAGFNVICPTYSYKQNTPFALQNTAQMGSQSLSDNRKLTPNKDTVSASKGAASAIGVGSTATTTSTSTPVPVPDLTVTINVKSPFGGLVDASYSMMVSNNTSGSVVTTRLVVDGAQYGGVRDVTSPGSNVDVIAADRFLIPLSQGAHTIQVYWNVNANTGRTLANERSLVATET